MTEPTLPGGESLEWLLGDAGWRGALHVLTSPTFRKGDPSIWRYVDLKGQSIFFDRMIAGRAWSSTEELMLQAAWSLFTDEREVNLWGLMQRLSDAQAKTVIEAMCSVASPRYRPPCGLFHSAL